MRDRERSAEKGTGLGHAPKSGGVLDPRPSEWDQIFQARRDIAGLRGSENITWLEWEAKAKVSVDDNLAPGTALRDEESDARAGTGGGEEKNVIRDFMQDSDKSELCQPQADKVDDFAWGGDLDLLAAETWKGPRSLPFVAWLDERSSEGGVERSRPYRGLLTAHDLHRQLKKPRFREVGSGHENAPNTDGSGSGEVAPCSAAERQREDQEKDEDEPDAERRLIFVNDLDCWTVYALVGTASVHQQPALRSALYNYLGAEGSIEVTVSSVGWPTFQLAFHLPYHVWRTSAEPCHDHRFDKHGEPLRHVKDVSLLNCECDGSKAFIYEAQISCVLAGFDEWRWVAYCFVDSYYDGEDGETVLQYHRDRMNGMHADPLEHGNADAEKPIEKAREFFLKVFRIRIDQVKSEWELVVDKVNKSIRKYEQVSLPGSSPFCGPESARFLHR
ncbi:uncharacterized protein Z518_10467 [Rhinocladiella mackenziei CBS 650.93]|uniref:Uncharacterized protein n=1 Tax=Rhinocladiella mackenziei CBS 650.93 TaxID=1442369 RepID=A0A0D2GPP0_9EURO|nr:uncharacterized protein Z518_10467 [Rhinocladiella mackenziei CBS 650.93]KIX00328.1 hypothetical protein Z518_10467 [Rhinocladiella mackenziei CBS 650.93]